jgi:hypothetical protein
MSLGSKATKNMPISGRPHGAQTKVPARRRIGLLLLLLGLLPLTWACEDDPFKVNWSLAPDTVLLYSLARPEMNLYSAFDFVGRTPVRVESPAAVGEWDLAIDTQNGSLVFVPPPAIGITGSTARIAPMGDLGYDDIRKAPRDTTLYVGDRPVPVEVGQLYVIRTRQQLGSWGARCVYYGKMEPLTADPELGILTFMYDVSPVCNDRKLIPPKK